MRKSFLLFFLLFLIGVSSQLPANTAAAAGASIPAGQPASPTQTGTPYALLTAAPNPDGSVIHEVKPGESLWNIALAYGIKIDDIKALNRLQPTPVLQPGQKIVVRPSFTPTTAPTITKTPLPPTRTPQPTRTRRPPTPTYTPTLQPSATAQPAIPALARVNRRAVGLGLIVSSALGILIVLISAIRPRR